MPVDSDVKKEALDYLKKYKVGALTTVTKDNKPYATAVYFLVDDNFNVTFVTKTETQKAQNLEHNNHAMLLVFSDEPQMSVQVAGKTKKITDTVEVNDLYTKIIYMSAQDDLSLSKLPPQSKIKAGDYVAYTIEPDLVRVAAFGKQKGGYTTIISK